MSGNFFKLAHSLWRAILHSKIKQSIVIAFNYGHSDACNNGDSHSYGSYKSRCAHRRAFTFGTTRCWLVDVFKVEVRHSSLRWLLWLLFIQPKRGHAVEEAKLFGIEPKGNFARRCLNWVRTMEPILLLAEAKIASECANICLSRISSSDHFSSRRDDIITFPDHGYDRSSRNSTD